MSPAAPTVTFDRLRWWIIGAAIGTAIISAVSIAVDLTTTDVAAGDDAAARATVVR